jgi:hypothetical protein
MAAVSRLAFTRTVLDRLKCCHNLADETEPLNVCLRTVARPAEKHRAEQNTIKAQPNPQDDEHCSREHAFPPIRFLYFELS